MYRIFSLFLRKSKFLNMESTPNLSSPKPESDLRIKAVANSVQIVGRAFNEVKFQAFTLGILCFCMLMNMIDFKQPLMQFPTWFPDGSASWYILFLVTILTWRIALNCECLMISESASAPEYIRSAIIYIMIYAAMTGAIGGRAIYDWILPHSTFWAIVAWIVSALILFLILRVHKHRKISQWFSSPEGVLLFPVEQRTTPEIGYSLQLSSYAILLGIAIFYFVRHSFLL